MCPKINLPDGGYNNNFCSPDGKCSDDRKFYRGGMALYSSSAARYCEVPHGAGSPTLPKPKAPVDPKPIAVATPPDQEAVTPEKTIDPKPSTPTPPVKTNESIVRSIFNAYDSGSKANWNKGDLKSLLAKTNRTAGAPTDSEVDQIFKIVNTAGNGKISFAEFFKVIGPRFKQNN